jgi:hypothetical protein
MDEAPSASPWSPGPSHPVGVGDPLGSHRRRHDARWPVVASVRGWRSRSTPAAQGEAAGQALAGAATLASGPNDEVECRGLELPGFPRERECRAGRSTSRERPRVARPVNVSAENLRFRAVFPAADKMGVRRDRGLLPRTWRWSGAADGDAGIRTRGKHPPLRPAPPFRGSQNRRLPAVASSAGSVDPWRRERLEHVSGERSRRPSRTDARGAAGSSLRSHPVRFAVPRRPDRRWPTVQDFESATCRVRTPVATRRKYGRTESITYSCGPQDGPPGSVPMTCLLEVSRVHHQRRETVSWRVGRRLVGRTALP